MADKNKTRESIRLAFLVGLAIVVSATFIPWGINALDENYLLGVGILVAAPVAIGVAIWFFVTERRKIASGLPMQDERSKGIWQKATSYSFYTTMYFLLFLTLFGDEPALKDRLTVEGALMLPFAEMIIACFVFLGYFHLKGTPE